MQNAEIVVAMEQLEADEHQAGQQNNFGRVSLDLNLTLVDILLDVADGTRVLVHSKLELG